MLVRFPPIATCLRAPGWVLFLFATACGGASTVPQSNARTILPDTDGRISQWLLQLADARPEEFIRTQATLVAATPPDVRFRVSYGDLATRDAFLEELRLRGVRTQERVETVRTAGQHDAWLRDLYVAAGDWDGTPAVLMHHPDHLAAVQGAPGHARTLQTVQAPGAGRIVSTPLRLEGGSVVSDSERASLSLKNAVVGERSGQFPNQRAFLEAAQEYWGRPVTLISTAWADRAEHLDLLMMPVGDRKVIVSGPSLAFRLLERALRRETARFDEEARRVAQPARERRTVSGTCFEQAACRRCNPRRASLDASRHSSRFSASWRLWTTTCTACRSSPSTTSSPAPVSCSPTRTSSRTRGGMSESSACPRTGSRRSTTTRHERGNAADFASSAWRRWGPV